MFLKTKVNVNNSTRNHIALQKNLLSKFNNILKNLKKHSISNSGRNKHGRITVRHKGGGCKKSVHILHSFNTYTGIVLNSMYDSKRSGFVSIIFDFKRKILLKRIYIKNLFPGSLIDSKCFLKDFKLGYRTNLINLPLGSVVSQIYVKSKLTYALSAGSFCQIMEKSLLKNETKLRLPSGRFILISGIASLGSIGNSLNKRIKIGKAGKNRLRGIRPSVRGVAMNPVDHPHGGKSNKGMIPVTPWGIPTRGKPTVYLK